MLEKASFCAAALLVAAAAFAIIDPRFTPVHLVNQSETIRVGTVSGTPKADEWKLTVTQALKGESARECVLATGSAKKEEVEDIRKVLAQNSAAPAIFFSAEEDGKKKGYLSLGGMWLEASSSDGVRWNMRGLAPKLSATWAGGTDMLISLCRYIVTDPRRRSPLLGRPVLDGRRRRSR